MLGNSVQRESRVELCSKCSCSRLFGPPIVTGSISTRTAIGIVIVIGIVMMMDKK